jgi:hypothetical protein
MPILVSAAFVWIASALSHMVLPFHKGDWKGLPDEARATDALAGVPAGNYMFPFCTMSEMKEPAFQEKENRGPNGTVVIWPGPVNMGRNLILTLLSYIVIGVFVAYLTWHAFAGGAPEYLDVFRIAGTCAFMAYGLAYVPHVIWFRSVRLWPELLDALIYALVTAGTFGWLWPAAVA